MHNKKEHFAPFLFTSPGIFDYLFTFCIKDGIILNNGIIA